MVDPFRCTLPKADAPPEILEWGDSHAYHRAPLLEAYVGSRGVHARIRFKAGCPPALDYAPDVLLGNGAIGCDAFNDDVLREVSALRAAGLRTVLLTGRWSQYFVDGLSGDAVGTGLTAAVSALESLGLDVVIVA